MGEATVVIGYDGEALRDGTMNVRDLAPALIAFGELVQAANSALNGSDVRVVVNIRAFRAGSMNTLLQTLVETTTPLFQARADARDILDWIGVGNDVTGLSLLGLIRFLAGRRLTRTPEPTQTDTPEPPPPTTATAEGGGITFYVNGDINAPVTIQPQVDMLLRDEGVRKALPGVVEPLKRPGIDRFFAAPPQPGAPPSVSVTKEEAPFFEMDAAPEIEEQVLPPTTRPNAYEVVKPVLKGEAKWELSDAAGRKDVSIEDEVFLRDVRDGVLEFGSKHVLIVDEEVSVVRLREKLVERRVIKRVREVKKFDSPPTLF
jgi:hypothetical protein